MDPIDPIDPAFLERTFESQRSGTPRGPARVQRVRELHDDQPGESWEDEQQDAENERPGEDEDSVVVELDHAEQLPDLGPDDDADGPHIDISV